MQKAPCLFNHLDQSKSKLTKMFCTIYSAVINLKYNTGIELDTEDIMFIAEDCIKKGTLDVKKGGSLKANFLAVYDYIKDANPNVGYKILPTKSDDIDKYLDKGYMIEVGIKVNKDYLNDARDDGIINDYIDYKKYTTGKLFAHATSLLKWIKESEDKGKYFIFDSYVDKYKFNLYEVNKDEMVQDILMNNNYFFYLK